VNLLTMIDVYAHTFLVNLTFNYKIFVGPSKLNFVPTPLLKQCNLEHLACQAVRLVLYDEERADKSRLKNLVNFRY
jgi:hypothetical protein